MYFRNEVRGHPVPGDDDDHHVLEEGLEVEGDRQQGLPALEDARPRRGTVA